MLRRALDINREVRARTLVIPENPFVVWVRSGNFVLPPPTRSDPTPVVAARLSDRRRAGSDRGGTQTYRQPHHADRAILNLAGNRTLERGQQFDVRIGAEDYTVVCRRGGVQMPSPFDSGRHASPATSPKNALARAESRARAVLEFLSPFFSAL